MFYLILETTDYEDSASIDLFTKNVQQLPKKHKNLAEFGKYGIDFKSNYTQ